MRRKLRGKLPVLGAVAAVCAVGAVFGISSLASASGTSAPKANKQVVKRVFIRGQSQQNPPHFVAPKAVHVGDKLKIINQTDPSKLGPHTFALVKQQFIPRTKTAQRRCFHHHHICRSIIHWFKKAGTNPVRVGKPGWDVEGTLKKKGDAWFTGNKPGGQFKQRVAADAPGVIHFQCAIHPFMHGKIVVKP